MTTTYRIGSLWAGQPSRSIDELIETLGREQLDPRFEEYGDFICPWAGRIVRFWGNFLHLSYGFQVDTDDPALIERLTTAIRANQQRPDYVADRAFRLAAKAEAEVLERAQYEAAHPSHWGVRR